MRSAAARALSWSPGHRQWENDDPVFLLAGPQQAGCKHRDDRRSGGIIYGGDQPSPDHEKVGLTFAMALRSILRQDPDIVMVGESVIFETAAIAVKAALTGHLVLSTLHTNDAAGAITRLRDMGVEPFLLASIADHGQAQRCIRSFCTACRKPAELSLEHLQLYNLDAKYFEGATLFTPVGCLKCLEHRLPGARRLDGSPGGG